MKSPNRSPIHYIKIAACILALGNLIALFLFEYKLPFHGPETKDASVSVTPSPTETSDESSWAFSFETDVLTYDGSSKLDLQSGVSIVSPDGSPSDAKIFANIATGDSISDKVIKYSADTEGGQITASRDLKLKNYSGPSITLPETLPQVPSSQLDSVLSVLTQSGTFRADDGFGNDITDSVSFRHKREETDPRKILYTFTVTNLFNDSVSVEADLTIADPGPVITLKEHTVSIARNSDFSPLSYVDTAVDAEGNSLFQRISIRGTVDTRTPGTYTLVYTVATMDGVISLPEELVVTVEE